ncbi:CRTAC1 family protein [Solwaraspora sp. WMMD1047]|uniref:CRTAC1 family protein n=1 Tax=Solwaraspora sp. WMMD1047 TaxID=3016102 RepID=UPI00241785C8|nr:CRTAC1 family protein [Solwaraspora sp. WMMD1047]MDG4829913.1 CRTAC1 family protein [Solwaraspora sp. WMMD1047]
MSSTLRWLRRQMAGVLALVLVAGLFLAARLPSASAEEIDDLADRYNFTPLSISLPGGFPQKTVRAVNKDYKNIESWISSVGASIAMNDLDGDGLANDLCLTDPRIDKAVVTPAPMPGQPRYAAFALDPGTLPIDRTMAPTGCLPGDFNEDGRMDLMVYFMGRSPILYLARPDATALTAASYAPMELLANASSGGSYTGPQWQSTAVAYADFDGDGHDDIYIGNYFPHGPVLDDTADKGVEMNDSMSHGINGGEDYIFRWTGATTGPAPTATYQLAEGVLSTEISKGWVLGAGAVDLDGDRLPELYLAHDFGPDRLLYNRSTPGKIEFSLVEGVRKPLVPKSKRVGADSFKGMSVDFGDLNRDGLYDMYISNITTSFGIEESHFAYVSTAKDRADLRQRLRDGEAPYQDDSADLGLAWSGWGWDVKMADFNNGGDLTVAQTTGFVKGKVNRWAQLQELATANDGLVANPFWWPHVREGDDVAGDQTLAFFVKGDDGRYVDLAGPLGLAVPVPTRGIATGDADGDGRLDFAVARQWEAPVFYHNDSPSQGSFLGLRMTHETAPAVAGSVPAAGTLPAAGSPVVGAQVTVKTADGRTLIGQVDGGSGHAGKRSSEVHIGLGAGVSGPLDVHIEWRDRTGQAREQDLQLTPGWHSLRLGSQVTEG